MEFEGRQMKQARIKYIKKSKKCPRLFDFDLLQEKKYVHNSDNNAGKAGTGPEKPKNLIRSTTLLLRRKKNEGPLTSMMNSCCWLKQRLRMLRSTVAPKLSMFEMKQKFLPYKNSNSNFTSTHVRQLNDQ
jgi:hypothetical protein